MARHKLGFLASLGFASQPAEQVAATLAEIGYDCVEWTLSHFNPATMTPAELAALNDTTRRHGLEISELVVQQDLITLDAGAWNQRMELTESCIRAAGDTGIEVVNLFSGPAPWDPSAPVVNRDITEQQAWEMLFRAFDRLLPVAEQHRVFLAVEAVFGMLCRDSTPRVFCSTGTTVPVWRSTWTRHTMRCTVTSWPGWYVNGGRASSMCT